MTDRANGGRNGTDSAEETRPDGAVADAGESVERYEVENGVVFYDPENPLAWVQTTASVKLTDAA